MDILHLLLLIAATWRLASLFANEEGPYMMFFKLRKWAERSRARWVRRSRFATLLKCEWCNSIWFGSFLALGYWLLGENFIWLILPLALSAGTIIVKTIVQTIKGVDVYFDRLNNTPQHLSNNNPPVNGEHPADVLFTIQQKSSERR
jgi:uncharacterized protein DUF1360